MITLQGKGVFGGIAIGEIAFFKRDSGVVQRKKVEDPQTEIQRFENAKAKAIEELGELYDKAVSEVGESNAMLFQTHQFMLEDLDYVEDRKHDPDTVCKCRICSQRYRRQFLTDVCFHG